MVGFMHGCSSMWFSEGWKDCRVMWVSVSRTPQSGRYVTKNPRTPETRLQANGNLFVLVCIYIYTCVCVCIGPRLVNPASPPCRLASSCQVHVDNLEAVMEAVTSWEPAVTSPPAISLTSPRLGRATAAVGYGTAVCGGVGGDDSHESLAALQLSCLRVAEGLLISETRGSDCGSGGSTGDGGCGGTGSIDDRCEGDAERARIATRFACRYVCCLGERGWGY